MCRAAFVWLFEARQAVRAVGSIAAAPAHVAADGTAPAVLCPTLQARPRWPAQYPENSRWRRTDRGRRRPQARAKAIALRISPAGSASRRAPIASLVQP